MSEQTTGVNELEVADPVDTGVNGQEVADPAVETGATEPNGNEPSSAWAEMRKAREDADRRAADAERRLAELEATAKARSDAIKRLTGQENADVSALAEQLGVDPSDVMATMAAEEENAKKDLRIKELEDQVAEITADKQIQQDLIEVQKIDPSITDLSELGETFLNLKIAGADTESAYWAAKAKMEATQMKAPKAPGKANTDKPEKTYFAEAEVDAMTPEQQRANKDKILASMPTWS